MDTERLYKTPVTLNGHPFELDILDRETMSIKFRREEFRTIPLQLADFAKAYGWEPSNATEDPAQVLDILDAYNKIVTPREINDAAKMVFVEDNLTEMYFDTIDTIVDWLNENSSGNMHWTWGTKHLRLSCEYDPT